MTKYVSMSLLEGRPNMDVRVQPAKFLARGGMTLAYRKPASERLLFAKIFSPQSMESSWSSAWDITRLLNAELLVMKQIACVVTCPQIADSLCSGRTGCVSYCCCFQMS